MVASMNLYLNSMEFQTDLQLRVPRCDLTALYLLGFAYMLFGEKVDEVVLAY